MKNEEILKAAIEKAWKGGRVSGSVLDPVQIVIFADGDFKITFEGVHDLIFSHDFAKAFWGEWVASEDGNILENELFAWFSSGGHQLRIPRWQYHLREMVIQKTPIQYLEQFLENPPQKDLT